MDEKEKVDYSGFYVKNYGKSFKKKMMRQSSQRRDFPAPIVYGDLDDEEEENEIPYVRLPAEYVYTPQQDDHFTANVKKKKGRAKKQRGLKAPMNRFLKSGLLAFCLVVISFCSTLLASDVITNGSLLQSLSDAFAYSTNEYEKVYYLAQMADFTDMNSAKIYSQSLREQGGAGYVISEGDKFLVMAAAYRTRNDCESVVKKLNDDGNHAKVYVLGVKKFKKSSFPSVIAENAVNNMSHLIGYADEIFKIANSLDKEEITRSVALSSVNSLLMSIKQLQSNFDLNTKIYDTNLSVVKLKAQFSAVSASLENLIASNDTRPNYLCDLRYNDILIINTMRLLAESL